MSTKFANYSPNFEIVLACFVTSLDMTNKTPLRNSSNTSPCISPKGELLPTPFSFYQVTVRITNDEVKRKYFQVNKQQIN